MPLKTKKTHHRTPHDKRGHRRSKKFLKVYAPYIPLLLILSVGFVISVHSGFRQYTTKVLGYATEMSSPNLLASTNKERAAANAQPLAINDKLSAAAQKKAEDMAARDYWSHNTPEGQEPWIFIQQSGYGYAQAAENLAYGFATSEAATIGWMNSPSHRENLLNGNLKEVGFGIANVANYQNQGSATIVVAMYGTPLQALAVSPASKPPANAAVVEAAAATPQTESKITLAQTVTKGTAPWINFLGGLVLGAVLVYLLLTHALNLRRAFVRSERFILHHPLLDITLVALLALTAVLSQTVGTIH